MNTTGLVQTRDFWKIGRMTLTRAVLIGVGTKVIRAHLRGIANAFSTGDFSTPAYVHMRDVPGTKVMTERRKQIRYVVRELRRGGELRITSSDSGAVRAVHEFLAFQRADHHAGGHAMHPESH